MNGTSNTFLEKHIHPDDKERISALLKKTQWKN